MSKTRQEKAELIQRIKERVTKANIILVTDFKGLTVEEMETLRGMLREKGVEFQVVKNTLAKIALKGSEFEILGDQLKENCAFAFGYDDPVVAAKVLGEYKKKKKDFKIKFGAFEGQLLDEAKIEQLSKLASKEELLSQMLCTLNAVPTNFVCLFANLIRGLLYALQGIKDQKEG
ncbi:50S ribosomal protein L10 [Desulfothermus okinawensis JCM 13304]